MSKYDKLFHLRKDLQNRIVPICPVLDSEGKFHVWIDRNNDFQEINIIKPVESDYFGQKADSPQDVYFEFMNFMYQRGTREDVYPILAAISNDMHNLAACFRKVELFHTLKYEQSVDVSRFVITEIEYIFSTCRSLFDLFQLVAKKYWNGIQLFDTTVQKRDLKDSFAEMALSGEMIRTKEELQKRFGLPDVWANFYVQESDFFKKIRKYRDSIHHKGLTPAIIFQTPNGFAIQADYQPFACFNVWKKETFLPNNLAPIKPVIAFVVKESFNAMNRYVNMLSHIIKFPPEIAPGYLLLMRGHHIHKLAELEDYIENNPWYPEQHKKN
jgi:hypothetical protein